MTTVSESKIQSLATFPLSSGAYRGCPGLCFWGFLQSHQS